MIFRSAIEGVIGILNEKEVATDVMAIKCVFETEILCLDTHTL